MDTKTVVAFTPKAEVRQMSNLEYHSESSAVSSSGLKEVLRSPAHYLASKNSPKEETAAMAFGTAFHAAVLEPDLFAQSYFMYSGDRRGKAYQQALNANPGKRAIRAPDWNAIQGMSAAVRAYEGGVLADALRLSVMESSIFWTDQETGARCKIRPDFMRRRVGGFDLKSTDDCRPEAFLKSAAGDLNYDLSAAMYLDGIAAFTGEQLPFYLVAVEKSAPYSVWVYKVVRNMSDPFYRNGAIKYRRALRTFAECSANGSWPGYSNPFSDSGFDIPRWTLFQDPEVEAALARAA